MCFITHPLNFIRVIRAFKIKSIDLGFFFISLHQTYRYIGYDKSDLVPK